MLCSGASISVGLKIKKDGIWAKAAPEKSICTIFKPFSKDRGNLVSTKDKSTAELGLA